MRFCGQAGWVKASLPLCVCLLATCTLVAACGGPADTNEAAPAHTNGAPELEDAAPSAARAENAEATESADPCAEQDSCGQISLTLKGRGSSCQLLPTVNDLTRPPVAVRFDCSQLTRGPDGYDFDALGHITLMGETCAALQKSGPHQVTLVLSCQP